MRIVSFMLFMLLIQGCSSVINGTTQKITVTSNVQGAEVMLNGVNLGRTPITTRVKREKSSHLLVRKEGYKDYSLQVQTKLDPWFWGNIVIGGLVGSTTDSVTGSTHLIDPDTIFVQMEPISAGVVDAVDVEIRNFVTTAYSNLVKDIKAGKGDYLNSLAAIMKIKKENQKLAFKHFKSMVDLYSTVHELAEEMVRYHQKNK
jgi:hypothetical protein